jgi:hypothetical protein
MLGLAGTAALTFYRRLHPPDEESSSSKGGPKMDPKEMPVLNVPPEQMREAVRAAYRLSPDARMLIALAEIHSLIAGEKIEKSTCEFHEGKWRIRYKGLDAGSLPEYPDFPDYDLLLTEWVTLLRQSHPSFLATSGAPQGPGNAGRAMEDFRISTALGAAQSASAQWRKGPAKGEDLLTAARALLVLSFFTADRTDVGDALFSRAIALGTIAKSLGGPYVLHDECLLSYIMGYQAHAIKAASALNDTDPLKPFLLYDNDRLTQIAQEGNREGQYLRLVRFSEDRDADGWRRWAKSYLRESGDALPILRTALDIRTSQVSNEAAEPIPDLVLDMLENITRGKALSSRDSSGGSRGNSAKVLKRIENRLDALSKIYQGPLVGTEPIAAFFRAPLFSALWARSYIILYDLPTQEAADQFLAGLGSSSKEPMKSFKLWFLHLAESKLGKPNETQLVEDLRSLRGMNGEPFFQVFDELGKGILSHDYPSFTAASILARRTDSRPDHLERFMRIVLLNLEDLPLVEKLCRSLAEVAPWAWNTDQGWNAIFLGEKDRLLDMLHQKRLLPYNKASIFRHLLNAPEVTEGWAKEAYARLQVETDDDWYITKEYTIFLNRKNHPQETEKLIKAWIHRHEALETGSEGTFAAARLAQAYYLQHKYDEGWAAVGKATEGGLPSAKSTGALLLEALGRKAEAEIMAQEILATYPSVPWIRGFNASMFWRLGKYDQAAELYVYSPYTRVISTWNGDIAGRFYGIFKDRDDREAEMAIEALIAHKVNPEGLFFLPEPFVARERIETAFRISSILQKAYTVKDWTCFLNAVRAYRYVKTLKGAAEAMTWVHTQLPGQTPENIALAAVEVGEEGLLWDLNATPGNAYSNEVIWHTRAVMFLRFGSSDASHKQALIRHFAEPSQRYIHTIGAYLLGLAPENEVLSLMKDPLKRCEVSYYLGLRAESDGRMEEASDWYRVCSETNDYGGRATCEIRWAKVTLSHWAYQNKALSQLRADRKVIAHGKPYKPPDDLIW